MKKAIQVLNEIRDEGVIKEYAVGGAMAAMFYTEPIATYDLDVFVLFKDLTDSVLISLSPIYNALRARGYQEQGEYVYVEGVPIQFLPATGDLQEEALKKAITKQYDGIPTRVMLPEYLIAIALETGRSKDKARVAHFLDSAQQVKLDETYLNSVLDRHNLMVIFKKWTT